jgi:DNA-binding winged helix-turn-helix (wHTH) protein
VVAAAIPAVDRLVLDLNRGVLLADGLERVVRPKTFALLRHLVENAERLINRDEIMHAVWPDVFVTDDSITQRIREICRALDDDQQRLVRTLPRRGYLIRPLTAAARLAA